MKSVSAGIQKLALTELLRLEKGETLTVDGEAIHLADVEVRRGPKDNNPNLATHQVVSIEVDPTVTPEQVREGLAREVMRKVQAARKSADFQMDDRIALEIACDGALKEAIEHHQGLLVSETLSSSFKLLPLSGDPAGSHTESVDIDGDQLKLGLRALPRS
jgi:isoleucyl-tRNA synthetase